LTVLKIELVSAIFFNLQVLFLEPYLDICHVVCCFQITPQRGCLKSLFKGLFKKGSFKKSKKGGVAMKVSAYGK